MSCPAIGFLLQVDCVISWLRWFQLAFGEDMDCEPHRRRLALGPGDTMTAMRWKENKVSFAEFRILALAFEAQPSVALDHENPLVAVLIVPLACRCRLSGRDDPLDAQARTLTKRFRQLPSKRPRRQSAQQVSGFDGRDHGVGTRWPVMSDWRPSLSSFAASGSCPSGTR